MLKNTKGKMIAGKYINRAIDYVLNNINEDLSVEEIASYCNFSRYYFSRMFKTETGESARSFIKRIKMEQSAFRLKVERSRSVTDIGYDYGYSSSNYSTAFKQHHGLSPVEFRRGIKQKSLTHPIYGGVDVGFESFGVCGKKISIETLEDRPVIYHRYKGNYMNLSVHWGVFQEKYKEYITGSTLFIDRTYDDPSITDINECIYDICMTVPENCRVQNLSLIQGGKFAVYHFNGDVKQLYAAYQSIFNVWLPQSKYIIDERYSFDIYRKVDCDSMIMEIDICIPVK